MSTETTDKTRKLVLILEGVAIVTALVLILVDYKLKNDLMDLYRKMEKALENGRKILGPEFGAGIDTGRLPTRAMARDAATVETRNPFGTAVEYDQPETATGNGAPKRQGRNGYTEVPKPDKQVGT